jgi:hypothetical protein
MVRKSKVASGKERADQLASLAQTKGIMAVLLRTPPKPHSEMKVGKRKVKSKKLNISDKDKHP